MSGTRIVVGAPHHDEGVTIDGVAYVFDEPVGGWNGELSLDRTLVGCNAGIQPVNFGRSVSIEGRVAVVGTDRDTGPDVGRAHAFRFFSGAVPQWQYLKTLTPEDGDTFDLFGSSVSLSADLAVVGAPFHDIGGGFYEFRGFGGCLGPGDIDDDAVVGIVDLLALLGTWGSCGDCSKCPADLDDDCNVGITDFLILLGNWGHCACAN